jgi:hypothetical protein
MKLDIYLVCVLQEFPQLVNLACVACTCQRVDGRPGAMRHQFKTDLESFKLSASPLQDAC